MATNNDIKYISFTFENEEQSNISPNDVEVEITALDRYKIAEYKFTNSSDLVPVFNEGFVYNYEDVIDSTTTIRTVYSTELPTKISFNGSTSLLEILYLDSSNITDASNMFYGCTKLTNIVGIKDWMFEK